MNLEIPEGANVQIFIGVSPPLVIPDQSSLTVPSRHRGILGSTLKVTAIFVMVIGGFWVGEQHGQAADQNVGFAGPPPQVEQVVPGQAAAQPPAPGAGEVPPNFQATLQQPPNFQPPPGQNAGSASGNKNPFGLQD